MRSAEKQEEEEVEKHRQSQNNVSNTSCEMQGTRRRVARCN